VTGGADDLPVGVAQPEKLPVVERLIDGIGADRLVEVLGLAAAGVAADNGRRVGGAGRDPRAGCLEQPVAADVVGVPVGVHDQRDLPGPHPCPCGRHVRVADEAAVDQGWLAATQQEQVGVGKWPLPPGHPGREPLGVQHHPQPLDFGPGAGGARG
jgi:hypothetical protein